LGSGALLDFYKQEEPFAIAHTTVYDRHELQSSFVGSIYQQPGALLLMAGPAFLDYVHAIDAADDDDLTVAQQVAATATATTATAAVASAATAATAAAATAAATTATAAATATATASSVDRVLNRSLLVGKAAGSGSKIPRQKRVSVVMWNE